MYRYYVNVLEFDRNKATVFALFKKVKKTFLLKIGFKEFFFHITTSDTSDNLIPEIVIESTVDREADEYLFAEIYVEPFGQDVYRIIDLLPIHDIVLKAIQADFWQCYIDAEEFPYLTATQIISQAKVSFRPTYKGLAVILQASLDA